MSNFFKGKESKVEHKTIDYPDYARVRSPYSQWLSGEVGKTGPEYGDPKSVGVTETQKAGMDHLNQYAGQEGTPELMELGANEYRKTLSGDYDPSKGVYYKALRESAKRNLGETQKNIADYAGGGGRFYSGARVKQQSEADVDISNALNEILGQMTESERNRRFQAAPLAASLGEKIDLLPATRASNIMTVGDLERQVNQAALDREYNAWAKANYEYPLAIGALAQNFQATKPPSTQTTVTPAQPSGFAQMMSAVSPMVGGSGGMGSMINPSMFTSMFGNNQQQPASNDAYTNRLVNRNNFTAGGNANNAYANRQGVTPGGTYGNYNTFMNSFKK